MRKVVTPTKTIRVPDSLWAEVKKKAAEEKITITSVIISSLNSYVNKDKKQIEKGKNE